MGMVRNTFRNIKQNTNRLVAFHQTVKNYQKMKQQEAAKQGVILPDNLAFDIKKALKSMQRKHDKYYGNTSRYKPHQGKQECARRLRYGSAAWYSARRLRVGSAAWHSAQRFSYMAQCTELH